VPKVAAIINWYGITDLNDMLAGPNTRSYAVQWLGSVPNRDAVANRGRWPKRKLPSPPSW